MNYNNNKIKKKKKRTLMEILNRSFFGHLLQLEELFHSKFYDSATLSNLINSYGILVEFYDSRKDPIKHYFLEKM